jgi:hypothetical protein
MEAILKTRVVYDALNIVTVDGIDAGACARPGGWEKLLPGVGDPGLAQALAKILDESHKGQ